MEVLLVIPVYNETVRLGAAIARVLNELMPRSPVSCEVFIVDNASTDETFEIAKLIAQEHAEVTAVHLCRKGRGGALKRAWTESTADILAYMDVDLSTDLSGFPVMVQALASGQYDMAVGSRLLPESQTARCWKREWISRCYNWLVKAAFGTRFSDAQCGFKGITREAASRLLPVIEDTGWFFDTELLVVAEKCGYRICDIPVKWTEDPDSRVRILSTAWADLKGIMRLRRNLRRGAYEHLRVGEAPRTQ